MSITSVPNLDPNSLHYDVMTRVAFIAIVLPRDLNMLFTD